MSTTEGSGANAEQIRYWNEVAGPSWVEQEDMLDAQISELGLAAMERAGVEADWRVLDVGCGCGQTSLQLAERVGPGGAVLGVDISQPMLERARARAAGVGIENLRFERSDAQTASFAGPFDLAFSRFGVMFFDDPTAAFANLRRALGPVGRLAFVCWQGLHRNPWMRVPLMAVAPYVEMPAPPEPGAPGPFAFADAERVAGILAGAGFRDVAFESLERTLRVGGAAGLDGAVEFLLRMGPVAAALREAGEPTLRQAAGAVREALAPHAGAEGVSMECAAWIVTARV